MFKDSCYLQVGKECLQIDADVIILLANPQHCIKIARTSLPLVQHKYQRHRHVYGTTVFSSFILPSLQLMLAQFGFPFIIIIFLQPQYYILGHLHFPFLFHTLQHEFNKLADCKSRGLVIVIKLGTYCTEGILFQGLQTLQWANITNSPPITAGTPANILQITL